MIRILPNEVDGLSDAEKKLENTSLSNIVSLNMHEIDLWLPKFKVQSKSKGDEYGGVYEWGCIYI